MRLSLLLLVFSVALFAGCDSATEPGPILLGVYDGDYISFANGAEGTISVTLPTVVDESNFSWTATGEFNVNGTVSPFALSGTGVYIFPDITLSIPAVNSVPARTLTGRVASDGLSFSVSQNEVLVGSSTFEEIDVSRSN